MIHRRLVHVAKGKGCPLVPLLMGADILYCRRALLCYGIMTAYTTYVEYMYVLMSLYVAFWFTLSFVYILQYLVERLSCARVAPHIDGHTVFF